MGTCPPRRADDSFDTTRQIHNISCLVTVDWIKMSRVLMGLLATLAVSQAATQLSLTADQKAKFVDMHNALRQATGASKMPDLTWSDELAAWPSPPAPSVSSSTPPATPMEKTSTSAGELSLLTRPPLDPPTCGVRRSRTLTPTGTASGHRTAPQLVDTTLSRCGLTPQRSGVL